MSERATKYTFAVDRPGRLGAALNDATAVAVPRRQKYGNTKAVVDGVVFDSKKEARRYAELKLMLAAGAISGLQLQPVFELQAKFTDAKGVKHRALNYRADFSYSEAGTLVIEDVKGGTATMTDVFKIKYKLMLYRYRSIDFRILT